MTEEDRCAQVRRRSATALTVADRVLTMLFYGAYAVLLIIVALQRPVELVPLVLVPGAAFVLVSAARRRLNAPRPYDLSNVPPLIAREGVGCSFPSRHAFSAFAIASCWFAASTPVAAGLLACAAALAWCRVVGGVHFPRDVVVGVLIGIAAGLVAAFLALCVSSQGGTGAL